VVFGLSGSLFAAEQTENKPFSYQAGYGDGEGFGGPDSVSGELKWGDIDRDSIYQFSAFQPYFDWKRGLNEDYGLKLGFNVFLLHQQASAHVGEDQKNHTTGGIYRFQGSWTAFGRGTGHPGQLEWRIESRSDIGGGPAPAQFGNDIAGALNTGFPYSNNFDTDISVLNWTQTFNNQTAGFAVGRLAFDAYLDAYAFQTPTRGFLNRSFVVNPAATTTGIGALGAVIKGMVSENIWLGGHIYDANAVNGDFDFDTIKEGEWLKAVEIGWTPSFAQRDTNRIQLTYWHKDKRDDANIAKGDGWLMSASYQLKPPLLSFLRAGHSSGDAGVNAKNSASLGFEYTVKKDHAWSVGAGWAKLSENTGLDDPDDEYVLETSYKIQFSKNLSFMPDVQLIIDPARNPDKSSIWLFGLRAILSL